MQKYQIETFDGTREVEGDNFSISHAELMIHNGGVVVFTTPLAGVKAVSHIVEGSAEAEAQSDSGQSGARTDDLTQSQAPE
jgi:hypothetical protein